MSALPDRKEALRLARELEERAERLMGLGEDVSSWGPAYETGRGWAVDVLPVARALLALDGELRQQENELQLRAEESAAANRLLMALRTHLRQRE